MVNVHLFKSGMAVFKAALIDRIKKTPNMEFFFMSENEKQQSKILRTLKSPRHCLSFLTLRRIAHAIRHENIKPLKNYNHIMRIYWLYQPEKLNQFVQFLYT